MSLGDCLIIGLTGRRRSGKDTYGELAQKEGFIRFSLAGPLKSGLQIMLGLTDEDVNGALKDEVHPIYGVSPRHMMQTLGTEWGRTYVSDDVWIKSLEHRMRHKIDEGHRLFVVTDVRFINEAEAIYRLGGVVIRILRPSLGGYETHPSEAEIPLISVDKELLNTGTLEEFQQICLEDIHERKRLRR